MHIYIYIYIYITHTHTHNTHTHTHTRNTHQDRRALSAVAKLEDPVDFEFKIPAGATWSAHVSTMSREWCDFVMEKPNRMWDWDDRLKKIKTKVRYAIVVWVYVYIYIYVHVCI